jgi:hypothetical protein
MEKSETAERIAGNLKNIVGQPARKPFDVGKSPFSGKGLVYAGAREFYDEIIEGGSAAVSARLDGALRAFTEQHFLASGWYDILPILAFSEAAARMAGLTHRELVKRNAAWMARRDLTGVYRLMVQIASPQTVAMRLGRLSMRYFDFGTVESEATRDGVVESRRSGIPEIMARWFVWAAEGFIPVAMQTAGAKDVRVSCDPPRPEGTAHGVPTVHLRFAIAWA